MTAKNKGKKNFKEILQDIIEFSFLDKDKYGLDTFKLKNISKQITTLHIAILLYITGDNTLINRDAMKSILSYYIKEGLINEKNIDEMYNSIPNKTKVSKILKLLLREKLDDFIVLAMKETDFEIRNKSIEVINEINIGKLEEFEILKEPGVLDKIKRAILKKEKGDLLTVYNKKEFKVAKMYHNPLAKDIIDDKKKPITIVGSRGLISSFFDFMKFKKIYMDLLNDIFKKYIILKNGKRINGKVFSVKYIENITKLSLDYMFKDLNPKFVIFFETDNREMAQISLNNDYRYEDKTEMALIGRGKEKIKEFATYKNTTEEKLLKEIIENATLLDLSLKRYYDTYYNYLNILYKNLKDFGISFLAIKEILKELNIEIEEFKSIWYLDRILNKDKINDFLKLLKYDAIFVKKVFDFLNFDEIKKGFEKLPKNREITELKKVVLKSLDNVVGLVNNWDNYIFNPFKEPDFELAFSKIEEMIKDLDEFSWEGEKTAYKRKHNKYAYGYVKTKANIVFGKNYVSKSQSKDTNDKIKREGDNPFVLYMDLKDLFKLTRALFNNDVKPYTTEYYTLRYNVLGYVTGDTPIFTENNINDINNLERILMKKNINNFLNVGRNSKTYRTTYAYNLIIQEINNIKKVVAEGEKITGYDGVNKEDIKNITKLPISPYDIEWRLLYEIRKFIFTFILKKGINNEEGTMHHDWNLLHIKHKKWNKWFEKNVLNFDVNNYKPYEIGSLDNESGEKLNTSFFHTPLELWHDNNIDLEDTNRKKIKYLDYVKFWYKWEGGDGIKAILTYLNRMKDIYNYIGYNYKGDIKEHKFGFVQNTLPAKNAWFSVGKINTDINGKNENKLNLLRYNPLCSILPKVTGMTLFNGFPNIANTYWTTRIPDIEDPKIWKVHNPNVNKLFPNDGSYKNYKQYMKKFLYDIYKDEVLLSQNDTYQVQAITLKYFNMYVMEKKVLPGTQIKILGDKGTMYKDLLNKQYITYMKKPYSATTVEDLLFDKPLEEQFTLGHIIVSPYEEKYRSDIKLRNIRGGYFILKPIEEIDYSQIYDIKIDRKNIDKDTYKIDVKYIIGQFLYGKNLYNLALWKYFPLVMGEMFGGVFGLDPITQNEFTGISDMMEDIKRIITGGIKEYIKDNSKLNKYLNKTNFPQDINFNLNHPFIYTNDAKDCSKDWLEFNKWIYNFTTALFSDEDIKILKEVSFGKGDYNMYYEKGTHRYMYLLHYIRFY